MGPLRSLALRTTRRMALAPTRGPRGRRAMPSSVALPPSSSCSSLATASTDTAMHRALAGFSVRQMLGRACLVELVWRFADPRQSLFGERARLRDTVRSLGTTDDEIKIV